MSPSTPINSLLVAHTHWKPPPNLGTHFLLESHGLQSLQCSSVPSRAQVLTPVPGSQHVHSPGLGSEALQLRFGLVKSSTHTSPNGQLSGLPLASSQHLGLVTPVKSQQDCPHTAAD